jgi:ribonuclease Z
MNGEGLVDLYFLGTGAGMPSGERNVTSIALRLFEERGTFWLFDCGEGTQHQILKSPLKPGKLEKLFVTHLHGDHIYGIPGLLTSRSYQGGETPLTIYGPPGIERFVLDIIHVSQARLSYELSIVEIEEGIVFRDDQFLVETARLEHRIESFGYRITESDQPGKLLTEKLAAAGVTAGPIYGSLKKGIDVTLEDGTIIIADQFIGRPQPGRIAVIMGDTRVCDAAKQLAQDADVLVHEATFAADLHDLAYKYYHATSVDAAKVANEANVRALILTHLSSRYQGEAADVLLDEARRLFNNTYIAADFWSYIVARKIVK